MQCNIVLIYDLRWTITMIVNLKTPIRLANHPVVIIQCNTLMLSGMCHFVPVVHALYRTKIGDRDDMYRCRSVGCCTGVSMRELYLACMQDTHAMLIVICFAVVIMTDDRTSSEWLIWHWGNQCGSDPVEPEWGDQFQATARDSGYDSRVWPTM